MKNIIRILIALISISTVISCTDEVKNREAVSPNVAPVLDSPTSLNLVLSKNNANDNATTFVWDYAAYNGTATVVTYNIEFAAAGTNFLSPTTIATTTSKFANFTVGELNAAALNAGFAPFVASPIDVRIKATVGTTGGVPQVSNSFTLTLTPYPAWPNWSMIGSAFDAPATDWNTDFDMDYSLATRLYSKTIHLNGGKEFKFRLEHDWGTNFGDDGNNLGLDANGANIPVPVTGTYKIVANFSANTVSGMAGKTYTITLQ